MSALKPSEYTRKLRNFDAEFVWLYTCGRSKQRNAILFERLVSFKHMYTEAGFLVRVHPEPCLILSRAQILALLCSSKFIPA
jgi:hypothetical protein